MTLPFRVRCAIATAAMLCLTTAATAQNRIETSDGFLSLRAQMPQETRVGEQFTYTIEVTNTSDNVTLYDVKLKQEKAKGFSIESVSVGSQSQKSQKQNQQQTGSDKAASKQQQTSQQKDSQQKDSQQKDSKQQEDSKQKDSKQSSDSQEASEQQQQGSSGSSSSGDQQTMQIDKLEPGETRKIQVKAAADEEGQLRSCLQIVSYQPAICLMSKVVKPELEITKNAPEQVGRCELIELEYIIKNGGTGDVQGIQVTDQLADGLVTIEGNDRLQFDVDGLAAGDTRRFVGRVFATKSGQFSSRAVAEAKNSDLQSRSKNTTTKVVAAELDVQVQGPNRIYGQELAQFTAMVTNNGNKTAENVQVTVRYPENTNLADLSDPTMKNSDSQDSESSSKQQDQKSSSEASDSQASASENSSSEIQPEPDENIISGAVQSSDQNQNQQKQNQKQNQDSQQAQMAEQTFQLTSLEPGQTAEFQYAIRSGDRETIPTQVEAVYVCSIDAAQDTAEAENRQTATGQASVEIVRLPALQLIVFDDEDPVQKGDQVSYTVRVWNEGDAKDQNVKLEMELPDGLEFASAEGPTEHKQDGSTVTFEPIQSLNPGERKEYTLTAKSTGSGSVRLQANLSSEMLSSPVSAEEPTRLFAQQSNN